MSSQRIVLTRPDDFHAHLREGEMLEQVASYTAGVFGKATIMPNTVPPILTGSDAARYRVEILRATQAWPDFEPLMTIKLTMNTTAEMIHEAARAGVKGVKLYPTGATHNSEDGVDLGRLSELVRNGVFDAIVDNNMVLCIHGEDPSQEVLEREKNIAVYVRSLLQSVPRLHRVVLEHVSTAGLAKFVAENTPRVGATITAHHLYLTLDDLIGGELKPHYFCKPVVKTSSDQNGLWWYLKNYSNFFYGSDSAPHVLTRKEACSCAAGVFTGPIQLPLLAHMFDQRGLLHILEPFVSHRGADFYGIERNSDTITLEKRDTPLPVSPVRDAYAPVTMPLRDGDKIFWHLVS